MKKAVVILAGGSGTRLWPLSTNSNPKQLLKLLSDKTLLRETFDRMRLRFSPEEIYVSLNIKHLDGAKAELPELPADNFIAEPCKMDTTAAVGLIAATINQKAPDTMIYIAQSDHYIPNPEELFKIQETAFATLAKHPDKILAIGTNPNYPEVAFGYIEMGDPVDRINNEIIFSLAEFKEKPDKKTAESFVRSWRYLWNLGNYAFVASTMLKEFKKHVPNTYVALHEFLEAKTQAEKEIAFRKCDKLSIDYGISEKSENILVLPGILNWVDVANWNTVYDVVGDSMNKNVIAKHDADGNLVVSKKKVALVGVHNIALVETDDAILVCSLDKAADLKKVVEQLPEDLQ